MSSSFVAAPARCVPRLRLFADTLFAGDDEVATGMARLDFDYGGRIVRARDPRHAGRDRDAESEAARVLEGFGALELAGLDDCAVVPGAGADYVLAVDGDVHALCAFSAHAVPRLRALGWQVDVAADYPWQTVAGDAPICVAALPDPDRPDWFGLELGIEIDGHRVDLLPALLELLDGAGDLAGLARTSRRCIAVRVDATRWLPIPPAQLRALAKVLVEMYRGDRRARAPIARASLLAELCAAVHDGARPLRWIGDAALRDQAFAIAMGPRRATSFAPPSTLRAELRPYQREGVAWLQHLRAHGAGGVLADDMGLGKTLQTIAHVLLEREHGRLDRPAMIVAPTSLVGNWRREFEKFAPALRVAVHHGPDRRERLGSLRDCDVIVRRIRWSRAIATSSPRSRCTWSCSTRRTRSRTPRRRSPRRSARSMRGTGCACRARRSRTTSASCGRCSTFSTPACSAASSSSRRSSARRSRRAATPCGSTRCASS